jgi:hypothetical protein
MLLEIENEIRLGTVKWGSAILCDDIQIFLTSKKRIIIKEYSLPYQVMLTYAKERKELPLLLKLWI